ncbi:MAG: hypothetical protein AAFR81_01145 [Chloroflexota bacterium]
MMRPLWLTFAVLLLASYLPLSAQTDALPRNPTIDEVTAYLRLYLGEPPTGFTSYFWFEDTDSALLHVDMDGDDDDDLIAQGWLFVAVMLWEDGAYSMPFQVVESASPNSGAWSQVHLQDWTLDGIPEIVFDTRYAIEGNGISGFRFERQLISCALLCAVAWEGTLAEYVEVNNSQDKGMYLYNAQLETIENSAGRVELVIDAQDFAFQCRLVMCQVQGETFAPDAYYPPSRLGAQVRVRYLWDGLSFLQSDYATLIESTVTRTNPQLIAMHEDDLQADIVYTETDNTCQLRLSDALIGESFACIPDFVSLHWMRFEDADWLVLEYTYFNYEMLVLFDSDGNKIGHLQGVIRDDSFSGIRITNDTIIYTPTRYTASCPMDLCWFTLNDSQISVTWDNFLLRNTD